MTIKSILGKLAPAIILAALPISAAAQGKGTPSCVLRVATFNLRLQVHTDGVNEWRNNRSHLANALIRRHDFDIFGAQEALVSMQVDVVEAGGYTYIPRGFTDREANGNAIFYKKDRFEVLDQGQFWYSETPGIPASKGWDAGYVRMCAWGKFRDKASGREFYFFNSHTDHKGPKSRMATSKMMLERIKSVAGGFPAFSTGDLNTSIESPEMQLLVKDGLLNDSRVVSETPPAGTLGTFHDWGKRSLNESATRIDFILTTKNIRVKKYSVLGDRPNGRFYSDHEAVLIEAEL
jgi:endonuclease/exonuclease/phosphatase family metal-dependent hydrolase